MARPALMTIVILSFQGSWNELNHFIVSTQSPGLVTLTRGVASLASGQLSSGNQYPTMLAAATLMTIPVAVIIAFIPMQMLGVTSNIMSLGGIAIAIGAMVDAAVVMIENAHKHIEAWKAQHPNEPLHGEAHWRVIGEAAAEVAH